jgi:exodeoxyribonuclease-3
MELKLIEDLGYHHYWYPAQKKGYSGVAILCKQKPNHVEYGCGHELFDYEGRTIRVDFDDLSVMSVYLPSGTIGDERQNVKYEFMDYFEKYTRELSWKYPSLIISGDYNICHRPIDIHNPKSNANSSGFLPEERAWMDNILNDTFIDTFRHFNKEPHHYTWWSFRAGSRDKNLGWRIDYHLVTKELEKRLKRAAIVSEARHSDHCPILLELK